MPVAVEEVALEGLSARLLVVTVALRLVLVIPEFGHTQLNESSLQKHFVEIPPVAVVPGATMGLPGSKAHPAEISLENTPMLILLHLPSI